MAVKPKLAVKSKTASKPIGAAKPNKKIRSRQSEFTHLAEDIISNINVGIYIVQNRKFVYVSPLFEKLSGYSYADLADTNPLDYLHPDDREMIRKKAIKLLKGKSSAAYEYRFTRKNGGEFWVLEMITSITYKGDRAALVSFMDITERKQMEEALRQSEEKHRTIIENIRDGYFEVDLAGNYIFFNESICEIHGYSKEEMMGMNYQQYVDKENAKKVFDAFNEIYKTGIAGGIFDHEIIRKDGTKRQVEISATLQKDSSGNPIGFRGTTRDVTERRKMEETIRQSEERYRTILDEMEDAYFEVDLAGNFIFFNDAICRLLKYPKEELLGKSFRVHVDKDDVPILYNAFGKIYRTGKPERGLCYKAVRKDGTTGFAEMTGFPLQNQKGEMIGFRGIGREITQRMKLEEKLRQSEEKYRTILENMQEGYFEVDLAGNITFCNDSMCRFLGYTQEEMMGINNRQLTDKKNAEKLFRAFNEVYKTGEPTKEFDWQIIRKDGTKRFIEASISLKKDSAGKSIGFQGITRDVTERKLNEEKILYMATHDTLTGLPNRLMFSQLHQSRHTDRTALSAGVCRLIHRLGSLQGCQ